MLRDKVSSLRELTGRGAILPQKRLPLVNEFILAVHGSLKTALHRNPTLPR